MMTKDQNDCTQMGCMITMELTPGTEMVVQIDFSPMIRTVSHYFVDILVRLM
jgi:hypothetical protein